MNFDLDKCRKNLKIAQDIIKKNKKNEYIEYIDKLEIEYLKYCNKFSPAYLSGSPWYVGPSLKEYILNNNKISYDFLKYIISYSIFNSNFVAN